ncbi:hypothetical protein [Streptomyces sp. NPDC054854]
MAARKGFAALAAAVPAPDLTDIDVEDRTVPADPAVRVRVYRPPRARGASQAILSAEISQRQNAELGAVLRRAPAD